MSREASLRRLLDAGDIEEIVRRFEGIAVTATEGYFLPNGEHQDLVQEARIGIAEAARDFHGITNAFPSFAFLCARREVISAVKAATRGKHRLLNGSMSLDRPVAFDDPEGETLADHLPDHDSDPAVVLALREELHGVLAHITTSLTRLERGALLSVMVRGDTYEQASVKLGVSHKTLDNALQRARNKLRDSQPRLLATRTEVRLRVYVPRRERFTPHGVRRERDAIDVAKDRHQTGRVIDVAKCALGHDGRERPDTRGHPRSDGTRPVAVWRVTMAIPT